MILARNNQAPEAIALLKAAGDVRDPEAARYIQYGLLTFAQLAEDKNTTRDAARRLAAMKIPPEERDELVEKLRDLDLKDEADRLDQSVSAVATQAAIRRRAGMPTHSSVLDYETVEQLQALEKDKNTAGALALVRNVLAALPPTGQNADQGDAVASSALQTLDHLHKRDEFIAEARKQIAGDPDSLTLNYQLALLCGKRDEDEQRLNRTRHFDTGLPVWVRLARGSGGEVSGAFSPDGKRWTRLGHATVPLGDAPEIALAAAGWGTAKPDEGDRIMVSGMNLGTVPPGAGASPAERTVGVTVDSVTLTPAAPAPDTATDGTVTLHGSDNGQETPDWDALPTVLRPMGAAQELVVRITAFAGAEGSTRPAAAVMVRASSAPDSPLAAVLVGRDGNASFVTRQGPDAALPYWRKLAALRPKDARYARLLATHVAEASKWDEAAALFDGLFARDPDEITSHYNDFANFYQHDVPRLAALMLNWQSGPANSRRGASAGGFYTDTARKCIAIHRDDLAVPLVHRAIELNVAAGNRFDPDDHLLLLDSLARLGHRDEVRDELIRLFVPPSVTPAVAGMPATKLGFEPTQDRAGGSSEYTYWLASANENGDTVTLPGVTALQTARPLGLLPDLEAALRARLAEPDGQQFLHGAPDWAQVFSRVCRHDPTVLAELPGRLNAKDWISDDMQNTYPTGGVTMRIALAQLLRQWPGHETLAIEALRYPESLRKKLSSGGSPFPVNYDLLAARVALQLGDPATAISIARAVTERFVLPNSHRHTSEGFDIVQVQNCLTLFLQAGGREGEKAFNELFERIRTLQEMKDTTVAKEAKIAGRETATVWLLDEGEAGPEAALVYDVRARHREDRGGLNPLLGTRGYPAAEAEGGRTLTFSYGRDPKHFETLGQLKATQPLGTWRGPVPPGTGFLKVTADVADAEGYVRVVRSANLWSDPNFDGLADRDADATEFSLPGWKTLPAGFWSHGTLNSPLPGRAYVQCQVFSPSGQTINGERVPIEPGHAYYQSAWLRDTTPDGGNARFGRRYLDAQGKVLGTTEGPLEPTLVWRQLSQRLDPKGTEAGSDPIPPGTAFIEPFIEFSGGADWTGLFLGRMD